MRTAIQITGFLAGCGAVAALTGASGLGVTSDVNAAETVGETVVVVSEVHGVLDQTTRELAIKDNVYSDEVIETAADAATRMVFLDGTELSLGPSSKVVLDRYVYDPNSGTGELVLNMVGGVFEFASGDMPKDAYDIRTPFGNLAVRGTKVALTVRDDWFVDVEEGSVVAFPNGADQVAIDAGGCAMLDRGGGTVSRAGGDCDEFRTEKVIMRAMLSGLFSVEPALGPAIELFDEDEDEDDPTGSRFSDQSGVPSSGPPASGG